MSVEERVGSGERVLASYDGEERWLLTDRRLLRGTGGELALSAVDSVERVRGGRDLRYLVLGLASLTLAVVIPTVAVGLGVAFFTIAPVGALLAVGCPVGLVLWFRSTATYFEIQFDALGGQSRADWRLPVGEEASGFIGAVREQL